MSDRNKIAQGLSIAELDAFVAELHALPGSGRTLEAIKAAAQKRGIVISLMSARSFRDTTFRRHLERLSRAQEFATQVAQMQTVGAGATLADASAAMLSQQLFDLVDTLGDETLDLKKAGQVAFIISKIRQGDVAASALNLKVKALEAAQLDAAKVVLARTRELKAIADDKSIDEQEKVARIRKRLFGEAPANLTPPRPATGVGDATP